MELVATPTGVITFGIIATLYVVFSRYTALGALSLPCVTMLTSMVYYYMMPGLAFSNGNTGFLGVYIDSMEWIHVAVLLYVLGIALACLVGRRHLAINPVWPPAQERPLNMKAFWLVASVAIAGLVVLTITNRLNLTGSEDFTANDQGGLAFIQLSISLLLPVTIVYAVRDNFGSRSLAVIAAVACVFLVAGFRFRIAILLIALAGSFCLTRGFKIGIASAAVGSTVAIVIFNAVGMSRRYGAGVDFSNVANMTWGEIFSSFGGEVGPIFAFFSVVQFPPVDLIWADPWIVAIARLVPTFLWPNKPYPEYLLYYTYAFDDKTRESAGIAGPQHAEILMMVGWLGLPIISFLYGAIAIFVIKRLNTLSREGRIAGAVLVPGVFGFYMQQRGYFFQNLCEFLFIIVPIFLMHVRRAPATAELKVASKPSRKW